jgi:DNA-binding MarR family transcriptional regulator
MSARVLAAIELFREDRPFMLIQHIHTFLLVARNEGIGVSELANIADIELSSMTRHLQDLSPKDRKKDDGLDLINVSMDPANLRRRVITLTPKGRARFRKLMEMLRT